MPVWNGAKYLREAIDSILGQTLTDLEFIIVDDGSTDNSVSIVRTYADPRIRLLCLPHAGIVAALKLGFSTASADWVARQDADDVSEPNRLNLQIAAVRKSPRAVVCHTLTRLIGDVSDMPAPAHVPRSMELLKLQLCYRSPITHSSALIHRPAFARIGGYRAEERHAEDFGLWGRLIKEGDVILIPRPMVRFRIHTESISRVENSRQIQVARVIAARHAVDILGIATGKAEQVYELLSTTADKRPLRDWLEFARFILRHQSFRHWEVWSWLLAQSLRSLAGR